MGTIGASKVDSVSQLRMLATLYKTTTDKIVGVRGEPQVSQCELSTYNALPVAPRVTLPVCHADAAGAMSARDIYLRDS